ncbi:C1 [Emilia yellow vein betasatellite]|uniref:C1 n=2 Tax=Betasatellite TaxID=190729 RepID=H9C6R3_9VIRU|nr:C1 [Emilia yellow vein virus-associated DNA beta]ACP40518.1 C1 [Emilia yellow vein virus-associated DNA beta]AFE55702.1 C1 [Emilia yellow vein virus-associated DNA beta]
MQIMTITYKNTKGVKFIIDVRLCPRLNVQVTMISTKEPILSKATYTLPYNHNEIEEPFDFNGTEEAIRNTIQVMVHDIPFNDIKSEDILDSIDITMMDRFVFIDLDTGGTCKTRCICTL